MRNQEFCAKHHATRARAATASRAYPAHTKRPRFSASANVRALQLSCKQTLSTQTCTNKQTRTSAHGCTSSYFSATRSIFVIHNHPHSTIAKILHILEKEVFGNLPAGANVSGELADAEWNHFNAVDASSLQRNNLGEKQLHGTLQIARLGNPKRSSHRKTDFMMRGQMLVNEQRECSKNIAQQTTISNMKT